MIPINLPQKANIQGLWHLNETSGTRYDETTNDNDLTDNATVLYGTGKIGNAADFELDTSEYLSITDALQTGLDITGEITICAWIKPETITIAQDIVSKNSASGNLRAYRFILSNDNKIKFLLSTNGTAYQGIAESTDTLDAGTWYHVGATLNQVTDKMQIYIGGAANGSAVSYTTDIYDNARAFIMGAYDDTGGVASFFDGLIDEVIVWNTCLIAAEVLRVKNITNYQYGGALAFFL